MRLFSALLLLFLSTPALAAEVAGSWKMTAEGHIALLLNVSRDAGDRLSATLLRPEGMEINNGTSIANVSAKASSRTLSGRSTKPGRAMLQLDPAKAGEDKINFLLQALDDGHAELVIEFAGQSARPIALQRAKPGEALYAGWEDHPYTIDSRWPDNPEMMAIFDADQAARKSPKIDWKTVSVEDSKRRARTAELVAQGRLRSASDFYAAAFIFQHGDQASDFLLAHTFAVIAASRGDPGAPWIAAATLDRYLQKIGQPQVYGTQYFTPSNEPVTQEPYNRLLVSDALRAELGVPPIAAQEEQRKTMQPSHDAAAKKP